MTEITTETTEKGSSETPKSNKPSVTSNPNRTTTANSQNNSPQGSVKPTPSAKAIPPRPKTQASALPAQTKSTSTVPPPSLDPVWKKRYLTFLSGRKFHDLFAVVRGVWSQNGLGSWNQYGPGRQEVIRRKVMERLHDDAWVSHQLGLIRSLDRTWAFNAELRGLVFRAAMEVVITEDLNAARTV